MKRYENTVILAFGDTHAPYHHKETLAFLEYVKERYEPNRVIHTGDLLDIYSVSAYPKDTDHPDSWKKEIKQGRKFVTKLAKIFPKLDLLESNHDDRAYKKSRLAGVPREFMLPYRNIVGAPDGWKWHRHLKITVDSTREQIFFAHHKTGGSLICAKDLGCSCVLGHKHSTFGATSFKPTGKKLLWGIDAGCLISDKGAPYAYNKLDRGRPIQGCVIIQDGVPTMIPLN